MTQDEIISLATESGLCSTSNGFIDWIDAGPSLHEMTLFAKLVAAKEREACAVLIDENANKCSKDSMAQMILFSNATAIRARGEA